MVRLSACIFSRSLWIISQSWCQGICRSSWLWPWVALVEVFSYVKDSVVYKYKRCCFGRITVITSRRNTWSGYLSGSASAGSHVDCEPKIKTKQASLWGGALIPTPHYEVESWHWPLTMRWRVDTDPSLWDGELILSPLYEVECWYWPLTMRWSFDTDPSLWGGALILTPHYEVEHWYWPLTMKWRVDTDPFIWGEALILTPHYEVEHWYWPLTMRWSIDTDPSWCSILSCNMYKKKISHPAASL